MFWKFMLYHAALWMCPPQPVAIAHQLPAPLTPEVLMYAPPAVPYVEPVACPPQVCATQAMSKSYGARFQFKTGPNIGLMGTAEEGAPCDSVVKWQGPTGEKGMRLVYRVNRGPVGELRLDCDLELIDQTHTQKLRASRAVTLDKPAELVFKKDGCEPMRAEVTVFSLLPPPMPVASAMTLPEPRYLQHPPQYIPAQQAMPAPMPVCAPVTQLTPVACPLPDPLALPTARPVSVEPTQVVQACNPVPTFCTPCAPVVRCAAVTPTKSMSVRFARHGDDGYIEYRHEDAVSCCKRRTLEDGAAGKLCLSAGKSCLHVKGTDWKAYAEQIDVREDGRVVLRGNVRMMCDKLGVCASVRAEELNVEVKNGKFEKLVTK